MEKLIGDQNYNNEQFLENLFKIAGTKTQKKIADKTGINEATISSWKNKMPTLSNIWIIADTYNCSIDDLLGRKPKKVDFLDDLKDYFIYDCKQGNNSNVEFTIRTTDEYGQGFVYYGGVQFGSENGEYQEVVNRYLELKKAFPHLDEASCVNAIDKLIEEIKCNRDF